MMVDCPLRCGRRHHSSSVVLADHQRLADLAGMRRSVFLSLSEIQSELGDGRDSLLADIRAALTDEDEIAHGEAAVERDGRIVGLGECAYCDGQWPCRTQRGIDRLLAHMAAKMAANA